ncbi:MAG TPA: cytochrome P450 [Solirubrobacteraceae bacterium]|nr:cytochrome P450 [Solirubrobacteraceae bacterium]
MALLAEDLASIDVASPAVYAQGVPHEALAALRRHDPVHWHPWPGTRGGFWLLSKHADVIAVGKDPRRFSSQVGHIALEDREPDALAARQSLIETDPPEHTRLRKLVSDAFTRSKVKEYEAYTRNVVRDLLDRAIAQGEFDWVKEISEPVPVNVLISILGLPEEDIPTLIEWTSELAAATDSEHTPDPVRYPSDVDTRLLPFGSPAALQIFEYGHRIGEERRKHATDDLVSRLVHAEVDGERLNDTEYSNFFELFIFAGNETTRTGISQGMLALMENPDQFDRLLDDPSLVPSAVDEVLRYGTPVIYFRRTATQDTEIRGVPIQAGDRVAMWFLSANFDEEVFEDPQRFDVGRRPNPHTAFGRGGPHFCLGSFLARLEIGIVLEEILARKVRFELTGPPVRLSSNFVNGLKSLPVRVVPLRH